MDREEERARKRFDRAMNRVFSFRKAPRSAQALKAFHDFLAEAEALLRRRFKRLACAYGCTACCYKMPLIYSEMEAGYLQKAVSEEAGALRKVMDRILEADRVWTRLVTEFGLRSSHESYSLRSAWDDLDVPCPLLQDNACMIYRNRPLECRLELNPDFQCQRGSHRVWPLFPYGKVETLAESLSKVELVNEYIEGVLPVWETGMRGTTPLDEMRALLGRIDLDLLGKPPRAPFPITTLIGRLLPKKWYSAESRSSIPSAWTSRPSRA